jgi:hypothetical protein
MADQRLNGLNPLAYVGVNPYSPPAMYIKQRNPTPQDNQNFYLGDLWLNQRNEETFILVSLTQGNAVWVAITSGGTIDSLTGNSGGAVGPSSGNINVIGDTTTIDVVGDPGTNTLTISAVGTGVISSLTGNSGGAVSPLAGNIDVVGDGTTITVTGNPGSHTLTISSSVSPQLSWVDVTGTTQAMAVNVGYTANNSGLVTFTLPATAAYGSVMWVVYKGTGGWAIAQNSGQTIHFGITNTTTGVGGSLASSQVGDVVEILCTTANTDFRVINSIGNITVV